jgi:MFS family permease
VTGQPVHPVISPAPPTTNPKTARSLRALDIVNLLQADIGAGVGPFLAVYLMAARRWRPEMIGLTLSAQGLASVLAQTPGGALVDYLWRKRLLIAAGAIGVGIGSLATIHAHSRRAVIAAQAFTGAAGVLLGPAIAAVTLGLVGRAAFSRRIGRNESFNHAGNVIAAAIAGLIGKIWGPSAIFEFAALASLATAGAALAIDERQIDHDLAREAPPDGETAKRFAGMRELPSDRRIPTFFGCAVLFHFANAAMLPLVGQRLAAESRANATLYMSACILVAQAVMAIVAPLAGRAARVGRKSVLMAGFAALPLRGILYTFSSAPWYLISVQALDGIGAGVFGVVAVIIISDLARGTGRFNLMQGALATVIGVGASASNFLTGVVVQHAGYNAGFIVLSAIAASALAALAFAMPETLPADEAASALTEIADDSGYRHRQ